MDTIRFTSQEMGIYTVCSASMATMVLYGTTTGTAHSSRVERYTKSEEVDQENKVFKEK
jgi:hypothetical protein